MGSKRLYYHGVGIIGSLLHWKPFAIPQGTPEKAGTDRLHGKLATKSPNYLYDITTHTCVQPREGITVGVDNDLNCGRQDHLNLLFLQFQSTMLAHAQTPGPLSWCSDDDQFLTISGVVAPGAYPGQVVITHAGTGFTPAVGMDVLLRDPDSGDGFVGRISAVGGGTITVDDCPDVDHLPTNDWLVVLIRFHFPDTIFRQCDGYDTETQVDDAWIPDLACRFKSESDPVFPEAYRLDLDDEG